MGEAKRRKDKDKSYGHCHNLSSEGDRDRHYKLIMNQLAEFFRTELLYLLDCKQEPDDFDDICKQVENWLKNNLKNYKESDRVNIISLLVVTYQNLKDDNSLDLVGKLINCASEACLTEKAKNENKKFNEQLSALVQMVESEAKINFS